MAKLTDIYKMETAQPVAEMPKKKAAVLPAPAIVGKYNLATARPVGMPSPPEVVPSATPQPAAPGTTHSQLYAKNVVYPLANAPWELAEGGARTIMQLGQAATAPADIQRRARAQSAETDIKRDEMRIAALRAGKDLEATPVPKLSDVLPGGQDRYKRRLDEHRAAKTTVDKESSAARISELEARVKQNRSILEEEKNRVTLFDTFKEAEQQIIKNPTIMKRLNEARRGENQQIMEGASGLERGIYAGAETVQGLAISLPMMKAFTGMLPYGSVMKGGTWEDVADHTIKHAGKLAVFTYVRTPGTPEEKMDAALTTFKYMATPALSSGMPTRPLAFIVDTLLNSGVSFESGAFSDASEMAREMAEQAGKPDQWRKYLPQTLTPVMLTDLLFSIATKPAMDAAYRAPEFGTSVAEVSRWMKATFPNQNTMSDSQRMSAVADIQPLMDRLNSGEYGEEGKEYRRALMRLKNAERHYEIDATKEGRKREAFKTLVSARERANEAEARFNARHPEMAAKVSLQQARPQAPDIAIPGEGAPRPDAQIARPGEVQPRPDAQIIPPATTGAGDRAMVEAGPIGLGQRQQEARFGAVGRTMPAERTTEAILSDLEASGEAERVSQQDLVNMGLSEEEARAYLMNRIQNGKPTNISGIGQKGLVAQEPAETAPAQAEPIPPAPAVQSPTPAPEPPQAGIKAPPAPEAVREPLAARPETVTPPIEKGGVLIFTNDETGEQITGTVLKETKKSVVVQDDNGKKRTLTKDQWAGEAVEPVVKESLKTEPAKSEPKAGQKPPELMTPDERTDESGAKYTERKTKDGERVIRIWTATKRGLRKGDAFYSGMDVKVVVFEDDTGATAPRGDGTDVEYVAQIVGKNDIVVGRRRATDQELAKKRERFDREQNEFGADEMDATEAKELGYVREGDRYVFKSSPEASAAPRSGTDTLKPETEPAILFKTRDAGVYGGGAGVADTAREMNAYIDKNINRDVLLATTGKDEWDGGAGIGDVRGQSVFPIGDKFYVAENIKTDDGIIRQQQLREVTIDEINPWPSRYETRRVDTGRIAQTPTGGKKVYADEVTDAGRKQFRRDVMRALGASETPNIAAGGLTLQQRASNDFDVERFGAIPLPIVAKNKKLADRLHKLREDVLNGQIATRIKFPEYEALTREERDEMLRYGWTFDVDRMGKPLIGLSDAKKIEYRRWQMAQKRSAITVSKEKSNTGTQLTDEDITSLPEEIQEGVRGLPAKVQSKRLGLVEAQQEVKPTEIKPISKEPQPTITPTEEGETVKVPMPKKQADALTQKEQKKYLLDEIDAAIENASDEKIPLVERDRLHQQTVKQKVEFRKRFGVVTIEVPGDGTFEVLNTKESLENFRKSVSRKFPVTTKPEMATVIEKKDVQKDADNAVKLYGSEETALENVKSQIESMSEGASEQEIKNWTQLVRELENRIYEKERPAREAEREKSAISAMKKHPLYKKTRQQISENRKLRGYDMPSDGDILNVKVSGRGAPEMRKAQEQIAKDLGIRQEKDGSYPLKSYWKDIAESKSEPVELEKEPSSAQEAIDKTIESSKESVDDIVKEAENIKRREEQEAKKEKPQPAPQDIEGEGKKEKAVGYVTIPDRKGVNRIMRQFKRWFSREFASDRGLGKETRAAVLERGQAMEAAMIEARSMSKSFKAARDSLAKRFGKADVIQWMQDVIYGNKTLTDFEAHFGVAPGNAAVDILDKFHQKRLDNSKEIARLLKARGASPELIDGVLNNEFYVSRFYQKFIMGEEFVPSEADYDAAVIEIRAGIDDALTDLIDTANKMRGGTARTAIDIIRYMETRNPALVQGMSKSRVTELRRAADKYDKLRQVIDTITYNAAGEVEVTQNTDAVLDAARSTVDYYLNRKQQGTGEIDISHMKRRYLEGAFRALYKEITDPVFAPAMTIETQDQLIANMVMIETIATQGDGKVWTGMASEKTGTTKQLGSKDNMVDRMRYGRLAGKFVTPELYDVMTGGTKVNAIVKNAWYTPMGIMRGMKLIGPKTIARNYVEGYIGFAVGSGDAMRSGYGKNFKRASKLSMGLIKGDAAALEEVSDLLKKGVVSMRGNAQAEDVVALLSKDPRTWAGNKFKKLMEVYGIIDFPAKIASYWTCLDRGMTEEQAIAHVKKFYQNPQALPKVVGQVSKAGIADYSGYFVDSIRIRANQVKEAISAGKKGDLVPAIGLTLSAATDTIRRSAMFAAKSSAILAAWAAIQSKFRDDDDELEDLKKTDKAQELALREFMPEWYQDAPLIVWKENYKNGSSSVYYSALGGNSSFPLEDLIYGGIQAENKLVDVPANVLKTIFRERTRPGMYPSALYKLFTGDSLRGDYKTTGIQDVMFGTHPKKNAIIMESMLNFGMDLYGGQFGPKLQQNIALRRKGAGDTEPVAGTYTPYRSEQEIWMSLFNPTRTYGIDKNEAGILARNKFMNLRDAMMAAKGLVSMREKNLRGRGTSSEYLDKMADLGQASRMKYLKQAKQIADNAVVAFDGILTDKEVMAAMMDGIGISEKEAKAVMRGNFESISEYRPTLKKTAMQKAGQ